MKGLIAMGGIVATLLVLAAPSSAAATRAEYVAQADQVCKASLKPAKKLTKPLLTAFRRFLTVTDPSKAAERRAFRRFTRTVGRVYVRLGKLLARQSDTVRAIQPPAEDAAVISSWIDSQYTLATDFFELGRVFKRNSLSDVGPYSDALTADGEAADALVAGFGFKYCAADPSQQLPSL